MRNAYCGVGRVNALPAMTARTIDINAEIFWIDFKVLLFCLWKDCNGSGTSVNAALRFGYWDALNAMNAALELELTVGLIATDAEDNLFVATSIVDRFGLELDL